MKNAKRKKAQHTIVITPSSHPLITWPRPIVKVKGSCPGSLVLQNFTFRSPFLPYPVQWTVTGLPGVGRAPEPSLMMLFSNPIFETRTSGANQISHTQQLSVEKCPGERQFVEIVRTAKLYVRPRTHALRSLSGRAAVWSENSLRPLGPHNLLTAGLDFIVSSTGI